MGIAATASVLITKYGLAGQSEGSGSGVGSGSGGGSSLWTAAAAPGSGAPSMDRPHGNVATKIDYHGTPTKVRA
jgi:hypothetical protein